MSFKAGDDDTICALSTPAGVGGIAVIRVSGNQALGLTKQIARFLPDSPESHRVYFGTVHGIDSDDALDEVLISFFRHGRSFTGEETCEISCHGGTVVSSSILRELVKAGCRMAGRGEFTYRAFMNGRLDLVQAESVLGLIESQSRQSAKVSLRQLKGHLSSDFARIEDDLLWLLAQLEASIDFSTEGIEVIPSQVLLGRTEALIEFVSRLIGTYEKGRLLRDGLQVALVGRPNVGKSSLLNAFLKEDRAIVTPIAGTTRDTVEGRLAFHGVPVTFVDTAGLRETDNEVEIIGIQRSRDAMEKSDLVFYVIDASEDDWNEEFQHFLAESGSHGVFLFNKIDLDKSATRLSAIQEAVQKAGVQAFYVSAKTRDGLAEIESMLESKVRAADSESSNVVTQARHLELLQKISSCLKSAVELIRDDSSPEFIAFELQESIHAIHELLGKEFHEQVIDRIFKEFCLGK
jgi:tRNA modification GTPase